MSLPPVESVGNDTRLFYWCTLVVSRGVPWFLTIFIYRSKHVVDQENVFSAIVCSSVWPKALDLCCLGQTDPFYNFTKRTIIQEVKTRSENFVAFACFVWKKCVKKISLSIHAATPQRVYVPVRRSGGFVDFHSFSISIVQPNLKPSPQYV